MSLIASQFINVLKSKCKRYNYKGRLSDIDKSNADLHAYRLRQEAKLLNLQGEVSAVLHLVLQSINIFLKSSKSNHYETFIHTFTLHLQSSQCAI